MLINLMELIINKLEYNYVNVISSEQGRQGGRKGGRERKRETEAEAETETER